jgi:hypothetical protein
MWSSTAMAHAERRTGLTSEGDVGFDADDDEDQVDGGGELGAVGSLAVHREWWVGLVGGAFDAVDGGGGFDFDAVGVEFGVHERAEVAVHGGQDLG